MDFRPPHGKVYNLRSPRRIAENVECFFRTQLTGGAYDESTNSSVQFSQDHGPPQQDARDRSGDLQSAITGPLNRSTLIRIQIVLAVAGSPSGWSLVVIWNCGKQKTASGSRWIEPIRKGK